MFKKILIIVLFLFLCIVNVNFSNDNVLHILSKNNIKYSLLIYEKNKLLFELFNADLNDIKNTFNLSIYSCLKLSDRVVVEGYSNCFNSYVNIDNKKVNFQISIFDDKVLVGCPLIYGSF